MGIQLYDDVLANALGAALVRWQIDQLSDFEMGELVRLVNNGTGSILGLSLDCERKSIKSEMIQALMDEQAPEEIV